MGRKCVYLCSAIIILSALILIFIPNNIVAVGPPVVNLEFDEGEEIQEVDVRPGESGLVTFPGTVSADLAAGGSVQDVVVELYGSTDQGWPVTISPAQMVLQPGTEEVPFAATVSVTPETSSYVTGILTIGGTAMAFPGALRYAIQSIEGTILIEQYYRFSVGCDRPYQDCSPDSEVCYNFSIYNEGNGNDSYEIQVTNLEYLTQNSFSVALESSTIAIPEKNNDQISILVRTPTGKNSYGAYDIELQVKSVLEEQNEGHTTPQVFDLTVRLKSETSTDGSSPGDGNGDDGEIFDLVNSEGEINFGFDLGIIIVIAAVTILIIIVVVNRRKRTEFF